MKLADALFGSAAKVSVRFSDAETRRRVAVKVGERDEHQYLFGPEDSITGTAVIQVGGRKLEHTGIKLELIGQIELLHDRSQQHEFTSLVRELQVNAKKATPSLPTPESPTLHVSLSWARSALAPVYHTRVPHPCITRDRFRLQGPGELVGAAEFPFEFLKVEKPYESYEGINARLRYFLRITISRQYSSKLVHEETFRVFVTEAAEAEPEIASPIKMEVSAPSPFALPTSSDLAHPSCFLHAPADLCFLCAGRDRGLPPH